jgi:hypothetical protein
MFQVLSFYFPRTQLEKTNLMAFIGCAKGKKIIQDIEKISKSETRN